MCVRACASADDLSGEGEEKWDPQVKLGSAGRASVVAGLLAAGAGKSVLPAAFDDRRKTLTKPQKSLQDLNDIFAAHLGQVTAPRVITHLPASASDLLGRRNNAGLTPLHVLAGGDFGACDLTHCVAVCA